MSGRRILVCGSLDPTGAGERATCGRCGVEVVVSPASRQDLSYSIEMLCLECGTLAMAAEEELLIGMGPAQLRELGRLGFLAHDESEEN